MSKKQSKKDFRKGIKKPDEFVVQSNRVLAWAEDNPDTLKIVLVGFVAFLVVIGGISSWQQSRTDEATASFYAASELYRQKQWQPAQEVFLELGQDHPDTTYGQLAHLYAGSSSLRLENYDEAVSSYRRYLRDAISSVGVTEMAHLKLAAALNGAGEPGEARIELLKAATLNGPAAPQVQLALGHSYETAGDIAAALDAYGTYLETEPQGASRTAVQAAIIRLGGSLPEPKPPTFPGEIEITKQ